MKYTVITYVPAPTADNFPKPGETLPIQVVETGCIVCVMDKVTGKLKVCWKHTHDRILWGRDVEVEEAADEKQVDQSVDTQVA